MGFVDVGAGGRAVGSDGAAVLGVRVGHRAVGDDGAAVLDVRVGRRAVGDDGLQQSGRTAYEGSRVE